MEAQSGKGDVSSPQHDNNHDALDDTSITHYRGTTQQGEAPDNSQFPDDRDETTGAATRRKRKVPLRNGSLGRGRETEGTEHAGVLNGVSVDKEESANLSSQSILNGGGGAPPTPTPTPTPDQRETHRDSGCRSTAENDRSSSPLENDDVKNERTLNLERKEHDGNNGGDDMCGESLSFVGPSESVESLESLSESNSSDDESDESDESDDSSSSESSSDSDSSGESSSILTSSLSSFDISNTYNLPVSGGDGQASHPTHDHTSQDTASTHEDGLAQLISQTMREHGLALGQALAERATCIESIKWLGQHLPESVVGFLINEIEMEEAGVGENLHSLAGESTFDSHPSRTMRSNDDDTDAPRSTTIYIESEIPELNGLHQRRGSHEPTNSSGLEGGMPRKPKPDDSAYPFDHDQSDSVAEDGEEASLSGPLHEILQAVLIQEEETLSQQRRHSCIGLESTESFHSATSAVGSRPKRRSSLPLKVRAMSASNPSLRLETQSSAGSSLGDETDCPRSPRISQQLLRRQSRRHSGASIASEISASVAIHRQALGIVGNKEEQHFVPQNKIFFDPFPNDSDDENEQQNVLREHRVMKTKDSIEKLSKKTMVDLQQAESGVASDGENEDDEEPDKFYFTDAIPPATRHDCALLFVDISGFTKLSTTLDVEPLSKTINAYFQMIVEEVEAFGGDVLKFAGDALFAEWQASTSNPLDGFDGMGSISANSYSSVEPWHGIGMEECVLTATECAARIVVKCSDFPVFSDGGTNGQRVTELNVHCGVGFGEVVGVHVGDAETRMEYLILGDPIEQVAEAIDIATRGEVVASPEALIMLEETAVLDECVTEADLDKPQVIATKSTRFFRAKVSVRVREDGSSAAREFTTKPRERLAKRCDDWDLNALRRLRKRIELYVHPVVVNDESAIKVYPGDRSRAQERHRSEAELRGVFTVFIMPLITARLTGDDEEDCKVLVLLNDIMLIMTRELARFKGQMRQFIVDDKGVVLIANFGLRGSTFPNMVAERALPFMTTVQSLLKAELDTECQMGATYGKAYCGVVGGVARHEYAVLGPSVNLSARLMANPLNKGMLVDVSVKDKAGSRQFRALPPVKAKGYARKVPIFEPIHSVERSWKDITGRFVGREKELSELVNIADDIVDSGGPSQLVFVTGEAGAGKTALCVQVTKKITENCVMRGIPHLILGNVFSEGDAFVPFSIARPIFTEILRKLVDGEIPYSSSVSGGVPNGDSSDRSLTLLIQICDNADIPAHFAELISRLILTRSRPDFAENSSGGASKIMLSSIAQYLVKAFLQCTLNFDLIVLALDSIANMDEMSWKVVELLYEHSQNVMMIGTTQRIYDVATHADDEFLARLQANSDGQFHEMKLTPMQQSDVDALIASSLGQSESEIDPRISRDVYVQSGGMPSLASEFLENFYKNDVLVTKGALHSEGHISPNGIDAGNIGELVLHRMDTLPSAVRTHLNLGAILGTSFCLMDVVTVFEQYRGVKPEERLGHAKSIHDSLDEAVKNGILESHGDADSHVRYGFSDHPYAAHNVSYKFTHDVWRSNILRMTLDEWKRDMHSLIAQSMETVMNSELANDYKVLTKLFCHWKESGSAEKAASLALKMGRSLERIGLTRQGLVVYHEALDMWKAMDSQNAVPDEAIGGLSSQLLGKLGPGDIERIIRLNVAIGRCYTDILEPKESIRAFQTALNLLHRAPSSVDLADRSIIFPVLSGLFVALRFGHNEDSMYEQGLVRMFLRETKMYSQFHYTRALAMQAEMFGRRGEFEAAIQTTAELLEIYSVSEHSAWIVEAYGSDRSAQCIAQSACWHVCLGNPVEALRVCDHVLQEILPKLDPQSVQTFFTLLYPILWVLKDNGRALEAMSAFEQHVIQNYHKILDERGTASDKPLHVPIMALLDLVATDGKTEEADVYMEWILVERNGFFGTELNFTTGSCGRAADSITAEICLMLANHTQETEAVTFLVRKGYDLARDAVELTKRKEHSFGMIAAHAQAKKVFDELQILHGTLPPDRRSRRLSCKW